MKRRREREGERERERGTERRHQKHLYLQEDINENVNWKKLIYSPRTNRHFAVQTLQPITKLSFMRQWNKYWFLFVVMKKPRRTTKKSLKLNCFNTKSRTCSVDRPKWKWKHEKRSIRRRLCCYVYQFKANFISVVHRN